MATRALVTGGAGFIGSAVTSALVDRGIGVRVLDDFSSGSHNNLEGLGVEIIEASVLDASAVRAAVEGVGWVFHLAAMVSVAESIERPQLVFETNVQGSANVLEAARQSGCERVVLSSSCAVYGDQPGRAAEDSALFPASPYAVSKAEVESAAEMYGRLFEVPTVNLRYFNVYGPRQAPDSEYAAVIPAFIQGLLAGAAVTIDGDGTQTRDFVHVEDVARANLLAAEASLEGPSTINIGSGLATSILELWTEIRTHFPEAPDPIHGPSRAGDIKSSQADARLAQQTLGFRAEIDLQTGLGSTVEWFRSRHEDNRLVTET